ncbi:MAG: hypothetical protein ABIC91_08305 [Nanoarchaeota archaeon]|nr:hypothetical protein [Nanoarchaeota archaeon]MBU1030964.1 hypothetical protein [Nanoarchaeota archaeon]MBU1849889.1 hypothetical protein [Nanoarchaeota archaeon]
MDEDSDFKAVCRKCGKSVSSKNLVLDPYYKMVVCASCVADRRIKFKPQPSVSATNSKSATVVSGKTPIRNKVAEHSMIEKVDERKINYLCPKCKFSFVYNVVTNHPNKCPYCKNIFSAKNE